jgi:hypothetical protein
MLQMGAPRWSTLEDPGRRDLAMFVFCKTPELVRTTGDSI